MLDLHLFSFSASNNVLSSVVWVDLCLELCFGLKSQYVGSLQFSMLGKVITYNRRQSKHTIKREKVKSLFIHLHAREESYSS